MDELYSPDDDNAAPKRRTRTEAEHRRYRITFRMARKEMDDLYRYARARKCSMSYMVREALKQTYPELFPEMNRHIRKPKKAAPIETPTRIMQSLATGKISYLDK